MDNRGLQEELFSQALRSPRGAAAFLARRAGTTCIAPQIEALLRA